MHDGPFSYYNMDFFSSFSALYKRTCNINKTFRRKLQLQIDMKVSKNISEKLRTILSPFQYLLFRHFNILHRCFYWLSSKGLITWTFPFPLFLVHLRRQTGARPHVPKLQCQFCIFHIFDFLARLLTGHEDWFGPKCCQGASVWFVSPNDSSLIKFDRYCNCLYYTVNLNFNI